ncbi:MAG: SH3 domain-containing protein [Chloroflexota bacterium]
MRLSRSLVFLFFALIFSSLLIALVMPMPTVAQDADAGTPPAVITPGAPLGGTLGPEVVSTLTFDDCYTPFPLLPGDIIYIEPGVNIRAAGDGSSAIVWNTSFNQVDEEGERLPPNEEFNLEATIVSGPVCTNGYNWWQVDVSGGNDGWVSEGRPLDDGGYIIIVPNFGDNCEPAFALDIGEVVTVTQNVRVRAEPNTNGLVRTVASAGSDVLVLSGFECNPRDGIVWYQVQVTVVDFTYTGWMSQGAGGAVWLIPTDLPSTEAGTLCGPPLDFTAGDLGYVNSFEALPRNLRNGPGLNTDILFLLVDGVPFEVIGGPSCVNNINWWNVRVLSSNPVDGWIAEGSSGVGYWLSRTDPDEFAR